MARKRGNNEGTVFKERNSYRVQLTIDGQRISKSFKSEQDAIAWKSAQLGDVQTGTFVQQNNVSLADWVFEYLQVYAKPRVAVRTFERYLSLIAHLESISQYKLQDLRPIHLQSVINNAQSSRRNYKQKTEDGEPTITYVPASPSSKKKIHNLLNMSFKQAVKDGLVKINPMQAVSIPKQKPVEAKFFTKEEIKKIRQCDDVSNVFYLATMIALATGMRASEVLGLRWESYDEENLTLKINKTAQRSNSGKLITGDPKTKASKRIISISKDLAELIALQKGNDSEYILSSVKNKDEPVRYSSLKRWYQNHLEKVGVVYQGFHTLRHTHATMLVRAGLPITDVSARLGHSKISTTLDIYSHARKDDKHLVEISKNILGI